MPATKIETGVLIDLKRLVLTPHARKHRPEKTASLAKSLKELNQQLEDIIVCPQDEAAGQASPLFDVLAGVGRKEAEESLGWEKGRCTIMYGLSPYEKLKVTLDENEERQSTGPLDDARIYCAMLEADKGLTQAKLAAKLDMRQQAISDYLILLDKLSPAVQDFTVQTVNLQLAHLLQICRLKTPEEQIEVAKKADEAGWTVGKLKEEVNKKVKAGTPSPSPLPKGRGPTAVGAPPDPYADLWSGVRDRIGARCQEAWEIGYVPFKSLQGQDLTWMFALKNRNKVSPQRISAWLKQLAQGIDDAHWPDPKEVSDSSSPTVTGGGSITAKQHDGFPLTTRGNDTKRAAEAAQHAQAMAQKSKAVNQKAAELWLPKTSQEVQEMQASPLNYRLPNTSAEWAEVEALAPSGPGAVYQWMLGPSSYWTKKAARLTWQNLGYPDCHTGCHQLIETLRKSAPPVPKLQTAAKPSEPPKAIPPKTNPLLEGLDPETRALVEAEFEKGPLI